MSATAFENTLVVSLAHKIISILVVIAIVIVIVKYTFHQWFTFFCDVSNNAICLLWHGDDYPLRGLYLTQVSDVDLHYSWLSYLISPGQNGRHFTDDIFQCIFLNKNARISIQNSLTFVPNGPFDKKWALVQVKAWRRNNVAQFTDANMRQ